MNRKLDELYVFESDERVETPEQFRSKYANVLSLVENELQDLQDDLKLLSHGGDPSSHGSELSQDSQAIENLRKLITREVMRVRESV